jgi:hypothetical protein
MRCAEEAARVMEALSMEGLLAWAEQYPGRQLSMAALTGDALPTLRTYRWEWRARLAGRAVRLLSSRGVTAAFVGPVGFDTRRYRLAGDVLRVLVSQSHTLRESITAAAAFRLVADDSAGGPGSLAAALPLVHALQG